MVQDLPGRMECVRAPPSRRSHEHCRPPARGLLRWRHDACVAAPGAVMCRSICM